MHWEESWRKADLIRMRDIKQDQKKEQLRKLAYAR
jgi:hypothetical protein